jgi:peptidoglycan hydrolase-like protein with peptidoglycan-binding domain
MSSLNVPRPRFRERRQLRTAGSVVQRNRIWAHRLGWLRHRRRVARLLGLSGPASPDAFIEALRGWQESQGLPANGVLGPSSWQRMKAREESELSFETGGAKPAPCTLPWTKEFNQWLQKGLNNVLKLKLSTDGVFGKGTAAAVGDFQKKQGLLPTFIPDDNTIRALIAAGAGDPPIPGRKSVKTVQPEHPDFKKQKKAYYKWVQDSLNRILGLSLVVDGDFGTKSKAALRDFQKQVGITASGVVNCLTEGKLIQKNGCRKPHPEVKVQLPEKGVGFYSYKMDLRHKQYAIAETVAALVTVGMRWALKHPSGPRLGIGEISLQGGGCIAGHASHQMGVDVDMALVRNDGREEHTVVGAAAYSRPFTQEVVDLLRGNGVLKVKRIFLNDSKVTGREYQDGHDNHIHVRFELPARFA